jgi:hypothetical protein
MYAFENDINRNIIRINLEEIKGFDEYIFYQNKIKILKELTLDTININCGNIILSSFEKIDITIKERFINEFIQEEFLGRYGLGVININCEDGYLRVNGEITILEQEISFDKNIKITNVDLYNHKYI